MCLKPRKIELLQIEEPVKPRYKKSSAIKDLEQMVLEADRAKHPLIPPQYVAPTTFRDDSPAGLIRCIIYFFKVYGYHVEQLNVDNRRVDTRKKFKNVTGSMQCIGTVYWKPKVKSQSYVSVAMQDRVLKIIPSKKHETSIRVEIYPGHFDFEVIVVSSYEQFYEWASQTIQKIQ